MPIIRKILALIACAVVLPVAILIWREPWQPMTKDEVAQKIAALLRYGAIDVPHNMAGPDHAQSALMQRVADGGMLSVAESARYRIAIQGVLADRQRMFAFLDNNTIFASDAGPNDPNNCGGLGIGGRHDLHAASAASNFAEMEISLAAINTAGPLGRIRHANRAYKSLTDLMVHLAPAQASVMLNVQPDLPADADMARAQIFDRFRSAMTDAGFAPIGSTAHKDALDRATSAFEDLALSVQSTVTDRLSPLEQRLAGRWLSIQSVSPRL